MAMTEISREYATAIFMLATEKNVKEEYKTALNSLKDVFLKNPDYISFLSSKSISLKERLDAIEKAFSSDVSEDVVSYLMLLCEKGRIGCFMKSVDIFNELFDLSKRVSNAKITSAVELTDDEKARLKEKLEKTMKASLLMEYFVDKSLIGGIVAEIDGKVIDGSIKKRLHDIKDVIIR